MKVHYIFRWTGRQRNPTLLALQSVEDYPIFSSWIFTQVENLFSSKWTDISYEMLAYVSDKEEKQPAKNRFTFYFYWSTYYFFSAELIHHRKCIIPNKHAWHIARVSISFQKLVLTYWQVTFIWVKAVHVIFVFLQHALSTEKMKSINRGLCSVKLRDLFLSESAFVCTWKHIVL